MKGDGGGRTERWAGKKAGCFRRPALSSVSAERKEAAQQAGL
ncbi:hypothetical protein GBL_2628 [Geobacillus kaustophilus GBlys]|uniref:Uncharacterized protein n=2 Tax=Geobacillus TaxID=129337 RepID=A0A7U9P7G2_GEOTM|nr:hypothetical protein T260_01130 [Geobacillus sp. MAS1]GAD14411.1 hypothetical protein GBL_2628 [Geobacillus kaustophilus GBlys]